MATIGTNVGALSASFYLTTNNESLVKSIQRLSSGSRLAIASDDAAGVAVSGKLDAAVARLSAAADGAQNMISYAQTADGFLLTLQNQLNRMSELAQRATNGAFSSSDLANYNTEFDRLRTQITSVVQNATFNGSSIFGTGNISVAINAQGITDTMSRVALTDLTSVGVGATTSISTTTLATSAIASLQLALQTVTQQRASVNADISRFNFYVSNIRTESINTQTANSRIKDVDIAEESTELSRNSILLQAATAMLAQANSSQQSVLSLLKS